MAPRASFRWLVNQYFESGRYLRLADNTRKNQRLILEKACETGGNLNYASVTKEAIQKGKVRREATPGAAAVYVRAMRTVFAFAVDNGWIDENPAASIDASFKSEGFHTWTEDEVKLFQKRHALGTKARLAMDLLLYTGLRVSDAIRLGPQHIKENVILIRTQKTKTDIIIPLLTPLANSIAASPVAEMLFLTSPRAKPWNVPAFSAWFGDRCKEAKVPGRAHGLRKAGATLAAENGATPHELAAMYGWATTDMAEIYTKKADRIRLAERAANKLYPNR